MQSILNETHVIGDDVPPHPFYMRDNLCVAIARLLDLEALAKVRYAGIRGAVITKGCYRHVLCFRPPHTTAHHEVGAVLQLPEEVGNLRLLRSDRFPSIGIEGPGDHHHQPLFAAIVQPKGALYQFLGKTGPHLYGGSNCGNDVNVSEVHVRAPNGRFYYLDVCTAVPEYELPRFLCKSNQNRLKAPSIKAIPSYPNDQHLLDSYTWIDAQVLISYGISVSGNASSSSSRAYDPFTSSFIMFADALTGVVSPGGADCVTKTHIPIRANFKGGKHPGQWRVGGEASFGWGGDCRFCTTTRASTIDVTIPFEVMCFRPLIPAALTTLLNSKGTRATPRPILCFFNGESPSRGKGARVSFPGAFLSSQVVDSRALPPVGRRKGADTNHITCVMVQDGLQRHLGAQGGNTGRDGGGGAVAEESSGGEYVDHDEEDYFTESTSSEDDYNYYQQDADVSFGDVATGAENANGDEFYGLFMCQVVSQADFHHYSDDSATDYELSYPMDDYVWVDASSLLSLAAKTVADSTCLPHPYDPVASFIMFADALTGVVSPGGVDCVTKTHIPIRAHVAGGVHPGQWRVGGEASCGWDGLCHMCTDQSEGGCEVNIPFEVLCHRPSIPSELTNQLICLSN